jgi:hypothetical protein
MAEKIYLVEETQNLVFENDALDEWKAIVDELKLEGQQSLINEETKPSPVPFQYMNTGMTRMFETLCPRKTPMIKYDTTPIPLKILGIIKLAESEQYFDVIEIWYNESQPDPVVVGRIDTKNENGWTDHKHYLMARWGDELRPFDELLEIAKKRWIDDTTADLNERISDAQNKLSKINALAQKHFGGSWINI